MSKSVLLPVLFLVVCIFIEYSYASCYANPGVVAAESIGIQAMDTCCWLHEDTCCARNGTAANLLDIENSLTTLVQNGLSKSCYYQLANLECIACDPFQTITLQPAGTVEGGSSNVLIDQIFEIRICGSFCENIYSSCSDEASAAALGVDLYSIELGNYIEFCEAIDGSLLTSNPREVTSIFYSAQFLVTDFDCYLGVNSSEIESYEGVCLNTYEDNLIPGKEYYDGNVNSASSAVFSLLCLAIVALFL